MRGTGDPANSAGGVCEAFEVGHLNRGPGREGAASRQSPEENTSVPGRQGYEETWYPTEGLATKFQCIFPNFGEVFVSHFRV